MCAPAEPLAREHRAVDTAAGLRRWAYGDLSLEAATELLIRGELAGADRPWVVTSQGATQVEIVFDALPRHFGSLPRDEAAMLAVAGSLGADFRVSLSEVVACLSRAQLELVHEAIRHAAGVAPESPGWAEKMRG